MVLPGQEDKYFEKAINDDSQHESSYVVRWVPSSSVNLNLTTLPIKQRMGRELKLIELSQG